MPQEAGAVLQELSRKRLHINPGTLPPSPRALSAQSPSKRAKGASTESVQALAVGLGFLPQPLSVPPLSPVSARARVVKDSPLCESPSKLNCGGLRLEEVAGFKPREKSPVVAEAPLDVTKAPPTPHASAPRRSPRGTSSPWAAAAPAPVERRRTQAVTELVFRVALWLVVRSQGESAAAAAAAAGDAAARAEAARQERWPRACHPLVLDLLLNIVTAEEALARQADKAGAAGTPAALRARNASPLSRLSTVVGAAAGGTSAAAATPRRGTPGSRSRGGSVSSTPRVRFHTYDLPAVETPDVCRPGSDQPMKALLLRAQRILTAATAVRQLLREGEEPPPSLCGGDCGSDVRGAASAAVATAQETRDSLDALVGALKGLSAAADDPIMVTSGRGPCWGPEHRKAAAFYSSELRLLCLEEGEEGLPAAAGGADAAAASAESATSAMGAAAVPRGLAASHVHGRYQDALSSVLRYELKSLLNVCVCNEAAVAAAAAPAWGGGRGRRGSCTSSDAGMDDCDGEGEGEACGCLVVVEGTGSVMFNLEDPAALINLALQRIYPMRPLAVELFPRDSCGHGGLQEEDEAGWDAGDSDSEEDEDGYDVRYDAPEERRRRKVWRRALRYVGARRDAAAAAGAASGAAGASPSPLASRAAVGLAAGGGDSPMEVENVPEGGHDAAAASGATAMSELCDGGDGGVGGGKLALTPDELRDMMGYVSAHQFLVDLFSDPVVLAGVAAGHWARVEARAKDVHAFQSESADNGCFSLLEDVESLATMVALQAPTVAALGQLLREEAAAAARRQHGRNNCRKRLKSRLLAASHAAAEAAADGLAVFPAVRPCCRRVLPRSCWP